MSACGTCPSCSSGVPVCVGNVCMAPEEAFVGGSFIFATFAAGFNFFVARREAVKKSMSKNLHMVVFFAIPILLFAISVQMGWVEIPSMKAIKNTFGFYTGSATGQNADEHDHGDNHGHSHGHAEWHEDENGNGHFGHFHHSPEN